MLIGNFEFDDAGRHFVCTIETPSHAGMQPWWWFSVATEGGTTRYAPFEASSADTQQSVKARVIAHYEEVLAIKARPVHPRPTWHKPAPAVVTPAAAANGAGASEGVTAAPLAPAEEAPPPSQAAR